MKKLSTLFWGLTLAALVGFSLVQVLIQPSAANAPDGAGGRTEAVVFGRLVSNAPQYVTQQQVWLMSAAGLALFGCVIAWLAIAWFERRRGGA
ncbi:hypothetical protein QO010_003811 [Caulobacter ginsengisoli]|uniref:Uncharacterized protein n=1 Tax=Caulobacter ginsengisoli TaxID=400775 RepID=A0ABU0IXV0_9CAUL|nr:hypothetical protein [Caulobacter ginsengisoli]MDQ0466018.1 hypothetical protein [Caulobacter ginsengisoli]